MKVRISRRIVAPALRSCLLVATTAALCAVAFTSAGAVTYDLKTDWSDSSNPNGPWTYRQGDSALLLVSPDWQGFGPAWAPSNTSGNFLPSWFKVDSDGAVETDTLTGDVVTHTADSANGDPSKGESNVIFTSPVAGTATISGDLWEAHGSAYDRDQIWQVLVNDVIEASGVLLGDDTENRSNPDTFSFDTTLGVGDIVELLIFFDSDQTNFGTFVGTNLTIEITPTSTVPLPGTLPLFGAAVAGVFGLQRWHANRRTAA